MKIQTERQAKFKRMLVDCTAWVAVMTVWLCIIVSGFDGWMG
jgi:hypothetical protein